MITSKKPDQIIAHHPLTGGTSFLTVTDANAQLAHFSLCVKAGHFFDPETHQGLAHLLEHMLFLGSRQHPKPNQIAQRLQQHGGNVNAWTAGEFANFHFSCAPESLNEMIPVFLETLFYPLLLKDKIQNEIQSIDAEFKFKLKDELRRLYQIHKETSNPAHPFSKFSVGNAELFQQHSLDELRSQLRKFHKQYFNRSNVRAAISSPTLNESNVETLNHALMHLPSGETANADWPDLYRPDDLQIQINVKPLQSARRLIITFAIMDSIRKLQKALFFISHLLGDESEGSLLAYLKNKGWASNLVAGNGIEGTDFKDFNINIQLTQVGEKHLEDVLNALFYTLDLIRNDNQPWRRDEKTSLDHLARVYSESPLSLDNVCELAEALFQDTDVEDDSACTDAELKQAIGWMTVASLRIKLISPDVNTDKECLYYKAEYGVNPIDDRVLSLCRFPNKVAEIRLPDKNPYVVQSPTQFDRDEENSVPTLISESTTMRTWFSQDLQFNSVKGDLFCSFDIPGFCANTQQNLSKKLWLHNINSELQGALYRANIAGLHYRLYGHQCGFTIHCRGFTQALAPLAEQVLNHTFNSSCSYTKYSEAKLSQHRALANTLMNKPINRLFSRLGVLIQRYSYAPLSLLDTLPQISYEDFTETTKQAITNMHCESFFHGNWQPEHALSWQETLAPLGDRLTLSEPMTRDVIKLTKGESLVQSLDCEHDDSAVVLYLQSPDMSPEKTAFCMVLEQMLAGPFFNALRTEQQLGYVVGTGYMPHNQHPGIAFYVQSPTHDVNQLFTAMILFLKEQIHDLFFYRNYWPAIQNNLLKQLIEPDLNLVMQSQRLWLCLGLNDPENKRQQELVHALQEMSFEDLVKGAEELLSRQSFGELILYAKGKFDDLSDDFGTKITDLDTFKANATFFS